MSAMSSKAEVVVQLVSPCEGLKGCEEHECRIAYRLAQVFCRRDLNYPPTAVGGINVSGMGLM